MSAIDVLVPCYNYGRFLGRCVDSILGQEGVDTRVLIIDDASTDDSEVVGRRLAESDSRVEYRRHAENKGHIATYNEGLLGWAKAKYSMLLSADDVLAPGALRRAADLMDCHEDVGMTYGMALIVLDEDDPSVTQGPSSNEFRVMAGRDFLEYCFRTTFNPIPTPTAVVRTALQQKLGGYLPEFPHSGDHEMWLRFACYSSIGVVHDVQAFYRWHTENMSRKYYGQPIGDRREFAMACKHAITQHGGKFADAGRWLDSISRYLADESLESAHLAFNEGRLAECQLWIEFAEEVWSGTRSTVSWWKLRTKELLGPALWQVLRKRLKSQAALSADGDGNWGNPFHRDMQIGWWPD